MQQRKYECVVRVTIDEGLPEDGGGYFVTVMRDDYANEPLRSEWFDIPGAAQAFAYKLLGDMSRAVELA